MTAAPGRASGKDRIGPPPPFDPDLLPALTEIGRVLPPDAVTAEYIPELRRANPAISAPDDGELTRGGRFELDRSAAPGADGAPQVPLLICRPRGRSARAVICYLHGGGMVAGDSRNGIDEILDWADGLALAVVSPDYRLAPEAPHPAPVEDCHAAIQWTIARTALLGCPSGRVIVAGASAGGGLAAGAALMARDRGMPSAAGLMLMAPMLDDRNDTASARQMERLGVWDRSSNETGWRALLGDAQGGDDVPAYAAPARAGNLGNLPPTFVDVGAAETFRDEAVSFARRIWADGGDAELHVWPGAFHGFTAYAPEAPVSQRARAARVDWLARLLAR